MEVLPVAGLSLHRMIVTLDIENSTSRPDSVKAELRKKLYEVFGAALEASGVHKRYRDRFIDRGDGILALIRPVDQVPKALLLNQVVPALEQLLTDYNTSLPRSYRTQRQLRVRIALHAGEVYYDANGCFGEALDIAFRLLDATHVKKALRVATGPLTIVISEDIYKTVIHHGCPEINTYAFCRLVHVQVAGNRYTGWIHISEIASRHITDIANHRRSA